jgi:hypothetical protein
MLRFRRLSAIEIAEGALLADICVIFQLLVTYLPVGGDFFRVLLFAVFAILVLRRGLYVGVMGMCVAVFITGIVTGPQFIIAMLLECVGGLFLGYTMKHRMRAIPLILLGVTCGALALYVSTLGVFLVFGLPFTSIIRSLHNSYVFVMSLLQAIAASINLGTWWQQSVVPPATRVATFAFTYWWALLYVALWCLLLPFVAVVYATTNILVRLLGYDVRPFPDGRNTRRQMRRVLRNAVKSRRRRKNQMRVRREKLALYRARVQELRAKVRL